MMTPRKKILIGLIALGLFTAYNGAIISTVVVLGGAYLFWKYL